MASQLPLLSKLPTSFSLLTLRISKMEVRPNCLGTIYIFDMIYNGRFGKIKTVMPSQSHPYRPYNWLLFEFYFPVFIVTTFKDPENITELVKKDTYGPTTAPVGVSVCL